MSTNDNASFERSERDWSSFDESNAGLDPEGMPVVSCLHSWPGMPITVDQYGKPQIIMSPQHALEVGYALLRAINTGAVVDGRVQVGSSATGEYFKLRVGRDNHCYSTREARHVAEQLIALASACVNVHAGACAAELELAI